MIAATFRTYYRLAKPGIVYGNAIPAAAAFIAASSGSINGVRLFAMLIGLSLVIGGACVYNNVLDRKLDLLMERTKRRAIPAGRVLVATASIYATVLTLAGLAVLTLGTNLAAAGAALAGSVAYVVIYGYAKRKTVHGTLVGSISGAMPPVVGYVAVTGRFDLIALCLFIILAAWQMPHFYAIAVFRQKDYEVAGLPVLPVVRGIRATSRQIIAYILIFGVAVQSLWALGFVGALYAAGMAAISLIWFRMATRARSQLDQPGVAKKLFKFSLIVLITWSALLAIGR